MKYSEDKLKSRLRASNLRAYNEKLLNRYDVSVWVKFWIGKWDSRVISEIGNNLPSVKILDVGCGTGRLLCSLGSAGAQNPAGTDIAPKIIELAGKNLNQRGIKADLKISDAENKLLWANNTFEVATMTGVLHHFFMPLLALSEVFRILRRGGKLILIEPLFFMPLKQAVNLYLRFFTHEGDCRFYSRRQAEELLRKCGFGNVNSRKVTLHSFIITGEKI